MGERDDLRASVAGRESRAKTLAIVGVVAVGTAIIVVAATVRQCKIGIEQRRASLAVTSVRLQPLSVDQPLALDIELTNQGQLQTLRMVHAFRLQTDYEDLDLSALAPSWLAKLPRKAGTTAYSKTPIYLSVQSDQLLTPQSVQDIESGTLKVYFAAEVAYSDQVGARAPLHVCGRYSVARQRFTAVDCRW